MCKALRQQIVKNPNIFYKFNKTGTVRITEHWGAFVQQLLQWKGNKYYIFWVCVCSLRSTIQCACATLSSVACPTLWCFSMLSHKWHHFQQIRLLNIICVFWFARQLLSETFLILKRTEWDMIINVYCSSRHPLFLSDFNEPCLILTYFGKILIYQFHENLSSGSEFFHAGGQTDRSNFANVPKTHTKKNLGQKRGHAQRK